eukprot:tig00021435_g21401.t1
MAPVDDFDPNLLPGNFGNSPPPTEGLGSVKNVEHPSYGRGPVLIEPEPVGESEPAPPVLGLLSDLLPPEAHFEPAPELTEGPAYARAYDEAAIQDDQSVEYIQAALTRPAFVEDQCSAQDGFHVKQVDFVRPFKIVGEVLGPAKIHIHGDAEYTADAKRAGTWKITQPYERMGHDEKTVPVKEKGFLETKQQVKVDKVVYGEKQIIEGQVVPGQEGATTWDWDTQDFKPTGPMVGKCGTATCGMKDKGPKEYTEEKTCDNLVIENVELKVNSLQEVEHKDFKQYKLHVDDSIPRLCQNTLPKGLLKAMAAKNIGIESLFKADVNFNVVKTEDITACEVQTIAKQDFELKYDEKHTLKWKQPISKECTKEWTQDGIEYGKGTYEQTDQADITGYYIQPGAELGQINTYIRQKDVSRTKCDEKTIEHRDAEVPTGPAQYDVEKIRPWYRDGKIVEKKLAFIEEVEKSDKITFKPSGVVEQDAKYFTKFQKCPLLKIAPNNKCDLTPGQKAAFKGHLSSDEIKCVDKAAEALVIGKCAIVDGKWAPAPTDGRGNEQIHESARPAYKEGEEADPTDTSPEGILATLKEAYAKELEEQLERQDRIFDMQMRHQQIQMEMNKVQEQLSEEQSKPPKDFNQGRVTLLQRRLDDLNGNIDDTFKDMDKINQSLQKHTDDVTKLVAMMQERAAGLGIDPAALESEIQAVRSSLEEKHMQHNHEMMMRLEMLRHHPELSEFDVQANAPAPDYAVADADGYTLKEPRIYSEFDPDAKADISPPPSGACVGTKMQREALLPEGGADFEGEGEGLERAVPQVPVPYGEDYVMVDGEVYGQLADGATFPLGAKLLVFQGGAFADAPVDGPAPEFVSVPFPDGHAVVQVPKTVFDNLVGGDKIYTHDGLPLALNTAGQFFVANRGNIFESVDVPLEDGTSLTVDRDYFQNVVANSYGQPFPFEDGVYTFDPQTGLAKRFDDGQINSFDAFKQLQFNTTQLTRLDEAAQQAGEGEGEGYVDALEGETFADDLLAAASADDEVSAACPCQTNQEVVLAC